MPGLGCRGYNRDASVVCRLYNMYVGSILGILPNNDESTVKP